MKKVLFCTILLCIMLFAQGENWVYRYNGPENGSEWANSIAYGVDGNIYAAGSSEGDNYSVDFIVISLTAAGDTNWVYRYNGPGNYYSFANTIIYGADGNIYAAGISYDTDTSYDFIVISLTTAGDSNWVYRYNGPGNGDDEAWSVVYGADGNIYVTGSSFGSGTNYDFIVISLTPAGDPNWVYRYNGPGNSYDYAFSLVYGADGNIYVAGGSIGSSSDWDFIIISLTTAGDTNWVYRYNGPGNGADYGYSLVYGADGKIYVGGSSFGSGTNADIVLISLNTTGDTNWVYRYNGPGNNDDEVRSLVYSTDGNIYAAGYSYGSGTDGDVIVISLTTAGDTNWVYRYNGPGNGWDMLRSLVSGADGNIHAAGDSYGSGSDWDFTVISIKATGATNWLYRYNGPGNSYDYAFSLVYGADGNIYAAGLTNNSAESDFTVISLDPDYDVKEGSSSIVKNSYGTTIFTGPLQLPKGKSCRVFDIMGRVVMPDNMKPGIYFIEIEGTITQKVVKVR